MAVTYYPAFKLNVSDACLKNRANMMPAGKIEDYVRKAKVVKTCIYDLLDGKMLDSELPAKLIEAFRDFPYENEIQRRIHIDDAYQQIIRCVKSFPLTTPVYMKAKKIPLTAHTGALVRPSFVLYGPGPVVNVVSIKSSAPRLSQTAAASGKSLELYAFLNFAKSLIPDGKTMTAKASFWYLRKKNDVPRKKDPVEADASMTQAEIEDAMIQHMQDEYKDINDDFLVTRKAGNIVSIEEIYTGGAEATGKIEKSIKPLLDDFENGILPDDCSDADCKKCSLYDVCKYSMPPQILKKEEKETHIADLVLSEEQQEVVDAQYGIFRVNAGAGAGKTMVVVLRIIALLNNGVKPEEILVITFSNTAAEELRKRIKKANDEIGTGEDISGMTVTTFNAFGDTLIRKNPTEFGFTHETTVIDDVRRSRIISDILKFHPVDGLDYRNYTADERSVKGALAVARQVFDIEKRYGYTPDMAGECRRQMGYSAGFCTEDAVRELINLYPIYDKDLKEKSLIEFSDQEVLILEKLHEDPYYFEDLGYHHIIVDEFQDTSPNEMEILKGLRRAANGDQDSLMVVGDDDQAIYGFRDTSPYYITHFDEEMGEPVQDFYLLGNYRSTPEIVDDFANKIAAANTHRVIKRLKAMKPRSGRPVEIYGVPGKEEEYKKAGEIIKDCLSRGYEAEDICVICAKGSELDKYADYLTSIGIPSTRINPERYADNSRVKAALALAALMTDKNDMSACLNVSNARLEALNRKNILDLPEETRLLMMEDTLSWVEGFSKLSNMEAKRKVFMNMLQTFQTGEDEVYEKFLETFQNEKDVNRILNYMTDFVKFQSKSEYRRQKKYPGVALITAHSSKGAQWPVVINSLTGYDQKEYHEFRHGKADEERRRLMFVSATRAKDELYMIGQFVAYRERDSQADIYNKFLLEAYEDAGKKMDPSEIDVIMRRYRELKRKEKKAEKAA